MQAQGESSKLLGSQLKMCRPLSFRNAQKGCVTIQLNADTPFLQHPNATWTDAMHQEQWGMERRVPPALQLVRFFLDFFFIQVVRCALCAARRILLSCSIAHQIDVHYPRSLPTISTDSASPEIIHSLLLVHFQLQLQNINFLAWCQVPSYSQIVLYRPSKVSTISQNAESIRIRERGSRSHEFRRCPRSRAPPRHQRSKPVDQLPLTLRFSN